MISKVPRVAHLLHQGGDHTQGMVQKPSDQQELQDCEGAGTWNRIKDGLPVGLLNLSCPQSGARLSTQHLYLLGCRPKARPSWNRAKWWVGPIGSWFRNFSLRCDSPHLKPWSARVGTMRSGADSSIWLGARRSCCVSGLLEWQGW